jgi:two-component system, OmpR family, KDP operon response regulator KdpE
VREWSTVPIICLTAVDTTAVKIEALQLGADDYVTKPFNVEELIARIQAVLRRASTRQETTAPEIVFGHLKVDLSQRSVEYDGQPVHLTKIEFGLLQELVKYPDRVVTYSHLLEHVWGNGYDDVRVVHFHMCNLRRKVEPDVKSFRHIVSVPGVGYRFRKEEA